MALLEGPLAVLVLLTLSGLESGQVNVVDVVRVFSLLDFNFFDMLVALEWRWRFFDLRDMIHGFIRLDFDDELGKCLMAFPLG